MLTKEQVLQNAIVELNKENQPFEIYVESGDTIVAKWKWMDARFFSLQDVTDEIKEFTFQVTLDDKGRWHEKDSSKNFTSNFNFREGKISMGSQSFHGNSVGKSFTIGIGKNKKAGETGVVSFSFDTKIIKEPIREYLKKCGWKKAGLFS